VDGLLVWEGGTKTPSQGVDTGVNPNGGEPVVLEHPMQAVGQTGAAPV
jgi:hypothetical protein